MSYYSEFHGEIINNLYADEVLQKFFDKDFKGIFLDVGAFEPIRISNSHHFHMNGWKCLEIEANPFNCDLLRKHRDYVFNVAISDSNKDEVEFSVVSNGMWTASFSAIEISEDYKRIFPGGIQAITKIKVPQRTLNFILEESMIDKVDIVSIDIEGYEFKALKGFDINKYSPKVVLVENVTDDINIDNYMIEHGYICKEKHRYNHYWVKI